MRDWAMRDTGRMRELLIIGMGPGHPDQVTVQAVQAMNRADVFFRIDKGDDKSGLNAARDEILRRHVTWWTFPSRRATGQRH
jgi:precorrin-2 methylase